MDGWRGVSEKQTDLPRPREFRVKSEKKVLGFQTWPAAARSAL